MRDGFAEQDERGYRYLVQPVHNPPPGWCKEMMDEADRLIDIALRESLQIKDSWVDDEIGHNFRSAEDPAKVYAAIEQARALVFKKMGIEYTDARKEL